MSLISASRLLLVECFVYFRYASLTLVPADLCQYLQSFSASETKFYTTTLLKGQAGPALDIFDRANLLPWLRHISSVDEGTTDPYPGKGVQSVEDVLQSVYYLAWNRLCLTDISMPSRACFEIVEDFQEHESVHRI